MDDEGLIDIPEREPSAARRWVFRLVLFVNALGAIGTAVVDTIRPAAVWKPLGIEKQEDDALRAAAKWSDGSLASLLERDLSRRSRVRKKLARPYTNFMFRAFDEGSAAVLVGRQKAMFLKERLAVPDAASDLGARRAAAEQATHSRRFAAHGSQLVTIPVPRKSVVFEALLPLGVDSHPEFDEAVVPAFRAQGVRCVDLFPALRALEPTEAYLLIDTHWSTVGIYAAALEVGRQTGWMQVPEARLGTLKEHPASEHAPVGDLAVMVGIDLDKRDAPRFNRRLLQVVDDQGEPLQAGGADASTVLCGTSFSDQNLFGSFLSHFLGTRVQNMNLLGAEPTASLLHMVQQRGIDALPERILLEIPNHFTTAIARDPEHWAPLTGAGEVLVLTTPTRVSRHTLPEDALVKTAPLGVEFGIERGRELVRLDPGRLAHSGGGVLELEIEGEVTEGSLTFELHTGGTILRMSLWEGPRGRMVLPLIVDRPSAPAVSLVVLCTSSPTAKFILHSAEVVSVTDEERGEELARSEESAEPGIEHVALAIPSRALERHDTLVLRLDAHMPTLGAARLEAVAEGGAKATWTFSNLQPGALVAVDVGGFEGARLTRLTFVAAGVGAEGREELVSSAVLYPLARDTR